MREMTLADDMPVNYIPLRAKGNVKPYWPLNLRYATVMPAKAGIHMSLIHMDSRLRGNDTCSFSLQKMKRSQLIQHTLRQGGRSEIKMNERLEIVAIRA